jgi:tetratricopeptide (TPR) repeat protein
MESPARTEFVSAKRMMERHRWREAADHLGRAIDSAPDNAEFHGSLAVVLVLQGKTDEALQSASLALSLDAKCGAAFEARSRVLHEQNKKELALLEANQGIQVQPGYLRLYTWAAWLCGKLVPSSALEYAERVGMIDPHSVEAALAEGLAREASGDLKAALAAYGRAIGVKPQQTTGYLRRAEVRMQTGDLQGAIEDLTQALELSPEDAHAFERRGAAKHESGDLEGAIEDYSRALELNPQDRDAYANRGSAKSALKDYKGALADLDRALEIDPGYTWGLKRRGDVQRDAGNPRVALQDYGRAIELDPAYKIAYADRGALRRSLKDFAGAVADLTRAIELDPGYAWALNERGSVKYYDLNDPQSSIEDFSAAIKADPLYKWAYANRGNVRLSLEQHQDAMADLDRALDIDPQYAWALELRAWCHVAVSDHERALIDRARLYQLQHKPSLTFDDPDSQFWFDQVYQHFKRALVPQIQNHGERLVEYWECYLLWGQQTTQTWHKGTSSYVHDARSGAGYVCITDKAVRIVSLGEVTRRFVKKKGIAGKMFLAALGNFDLSHRELSDKVWLISHGDVLGVSSSDDVVLNTSSGNWHMLPYWGGEKPSLVIALNMARSGRLADIWRPKEPTTLRVDPGGVSHNDILGTIKHLAELRDAGAITAEEYETKKEELLSRL